MTKITLFAQAIGKLPKEKIERLFESPVQTNIARATILGTSFVGMMFSQFSNCDSVRDISNGLNSANGNLNHLGIARAPSKSTIAYRNAHRNSKVFRDIYYAIFQHFGQQSLWRHRKFRFKAPIKLLDSSMVTLTLSLYDWAHYTTTRDLCKIPL